MKIEDIGTHNIFLIIGSTNELLLKNFLILQNHVQLEATRMIIWTRVKNVLITWSVQKVQPCVQLVNLARNETQEELLVVRIVNKNRAEMIISI